MPEIITKHPDTVMGVLSGVGAECGKNLPQKILTECPPARFCALPNGEICVYDVSNFGEMTQVSAKDLASQVCGKTSSEGGCAVARATPPLGTIGPALALVGVALLGCVIRRARHRPVLRRARQR